MITFKSQDSGKTLAIGGVSSLGSEVGIVGPFPRYSISREDLTLADGTYLNSKFNITVTGTATLKSGTSQDMLVKGQRQAAVQGEALILSQLNRNQWPMHGNGVLEISAYGGITTNTIKYIDARITSIDLPEQNETAGVQNQEYSIQFEAYEDGSVGSNANDPAGTTQPTYNLSSVEESWDVSPAEDRYSYDGNAAATRYKAYTLTHTVSATGLKSFSGVSAKEAWEEAAAVVLARASDSPATSTTNVLGLPGTSFNPYTNLGIPAGTAYDHVRTVNSDMTGGKYSVTNTWVISDSPQAATIDMEVSYEQSNVESANTATVSGTVTGLETGTASGASSTKYTNAAQAYSTIEGNFYAAAVAEYTGPNALKADEYSKNVGRNKATGTITFSVQYRDHLTLNDGAIEDSVQVEDNGGTDVVAIIGVLLKPDGPVMQDMGSITEKRKSVTYTAKMKVINRGSQPTHGPGIVDGYQPPSSYVSSSTQSWNSSTGDYTVTKEWVYTSAGSTYAP